MMLCKLTLFFVAIVLIGVGFSYCDIFDDKKLEYLSIVQGIIFMVSNVIAILASVIAMAKKADFSYLYTIILIGVNLLIPICYELMKLFKYKNENNKQYKKENENILKEIDILKKENEELKIKNEELRILVVKSIDKDFKY